MNEAEEKFYKQGFNLARTQALLKIPWIESHNPDPKFRAGAEWAICLVCEIIRDMQPYND